MTDVFLGGPEKDIVRSKFDAPLIEGDYKRRNAPITYFGLCGAYMLDVLAWRPYVGGIIAVERDPDQVPLILMTACSNGLMDNLAVFHGDVNDLLIDQEDEDGQPLPDSPFDLVNLDYYGPPLLKDFEGNAKPIQAIRALFSRQSRLGESFRLLITCTVRVKDKGELDTILRDIESDFKGSGTDASKSIEWYLDKTVDWKMKVWLPRTLDTIATADRFSLRDFGALRYSGTEGAFMIHFNLGFLFDPTRSTAKSLSPKQLLEAPMYYVKGDRVARVREEPPTPGNRV